MAIEQWPGERATPRAAVRDRRRRARRCRAACAAARLGTARPDRRRGRARDARQLWLARRGRVARSGRAGPAPRRGTGQAARRSAFELTRAAPGAHAGRPHRPGESGRGPRRRSDRSWRTCSARSLSRRPAGRAEHAAEGSDHLGGTLSASLVHPREVFKPALLEPAVSIILLHNHPSGDPTPSKGGHQAHAAAGGVRACSSSDPRPRDRRPGTLREPRGARYHLNGGSTPPGGQHGDQGEECRARGAEGSGSSSARRALLSGRARAQGGCAGNFGRPMAFFSTGDNHHDVAVMEVGAEGAAASGRRGRALSRGAADGTTSTSCGRPRRIWKPTAIPSSD